MSASAPRTTVAANLTVRCLWCAETITPDDLRHALLNGYHDACAMRVVHGSIARLEKLL